MTDTTLNDAAVFPEDLGTGVPTSDSADYASAGHHGLLVTHRGGGYVASGMQFTVDTGNDEIDVSVGYAFIEVDGVDVQSGDVNSYDTSLPDPMVMQVILPSSVTLDAEVDATSDVYLAVPTDSNDNAYIRHGDGVREPTDPSIQLGTADTSTGDTTRTSETPTVSGGITFQNVPDANDVIDITYSGTTPQITVSGSRSGSTPMFSDGNGTGITEIGNNLVLSADGTSVAHVRSDGKIEWVTGGSGLVFEDENIDGSKWQLSPEPSVDGFRFEYNGTETIIKNNGNVEIRDGTIEHSINNVSSDTSTNGLEYYSVDSSSSTRTLTLASDDAVNGAKIAVKRNGGNDVTIDTEGSETIDGASSTTLTTDDESVTLIYNDSNTDWEIY
jgi:hypothetical protein